MPYIRSYLLQFGFVVFLSLVSLWAEGQSRLQYIPLPNELRDINQEFSGMAQLGNSVYMLPQYGNYKEAGLNGQFDMYSFKADSINRVVKGLDTILTSYKTIAVRGLERLPDYIKKVYQGFETLAFVDKYAYIAMETVDTASNCFLLRGTIDTINNEVLIDHKTYIALKRPFFISNAGFESITWLPQEKKLIAFYEFNANVQGNIAYMIDTSLTKSPEAIKTPFLYFRNTDAVTGQDGSIYSLNYYWDGDYDKYLNNGRVTNAEKAIKRALPSLKDSLSQNPDYLKSKTFARIVRLKNYRKKRWKEVVVFEGFRNNWEGLTLFKKGALIVTDANRSVKQLTQLAYIEF